MLNAIQSVLSIMFIIFVGYILTKKNWFNDDTAALFSRLVVNISLPALMISSILTNFERSALVQSLSGLIIPFISMFICYAVAILTAAAINVDPQRRGVFKTMFFASNSIFIGMPVNLALFGEKCVPFVLLYYAANSSLFWTLGICSISHDTSKEKNKIFNLVTLKRIFSPPLLCLIVGILLVAFEIKLPLFIMDSCRYLGNLTTPLSLLFIGITFHSVHLSDLKLSKDMIALIIGRFIISPAAVFLLTLVIPTPSLMAKVFIIQASMPIITQSAIVSREFGGDHKYAALMVTASNIASIFFIPFYMQMFEYFVV